MAGPHAGNRNRPAYSGQARFRFPKQIIELFAPRPPLAFKPPPNRRRLPPMTGLAAYVSMFKSLPPTESKPEAAKSEAENGKADEPAKVIPAEKPFETPARRRARKRVARLSARKARLAAAAKEWDPNARAEEKTREPHRTLFVHGFPRETPAARLRTEFETYGRVSQVIVPKDKDGVPRGYAFIEFEREAGLKQAYDQARGRKIDGSRIIVDVERGRTVQGWKPNRLNGSNASSFQSRPPPMRGHHYRR